MLTSKLCCYADFLSEWYTSQAVQLHLEPDARGKTPEQRIMHRKLWEWCAIAEVLEQHGMLQTGRTGLGFAVGTEPLASYFAAKGASVIGTDLGADQAGWSGTNEYAASREALYKDYLIERRTFESFVRFQPLDMREVRSFSRRTFDFVWSSCSFEHLGSLDAGLRFVMEAMELVKPGGFAVHTTEFNVSSNTDTVETGGSVIYRQQDIEKLARALRSIGCSLEPVSFDAGNDHDDLAYDHPPWEKNGRRHLKLLLDSYISTSLLLVIRKAVARGAPDDFEVWNPFAAKK